MADRVLVWDSEAVQGDGRSQGPSHVLDRDYSPIRCTCVSKQTADSIGHQFDIRDDGVSIFEVLPTIDPGESNNEAVEDSFAEASGHMEKGSVITLDRLAGSGHITVSLELEALPDDDEPESAP